MESRFAVLDPSMELCDVLRHCHQYAFGKNIFSAPAQEPSESAILFDHCECTFCLDAPVHPQHRSFFAGNVCKTLLPLPFKFPGYLQPFEPFLFRRLPVPASDTFRLVRTPLALMALI